jgi:hypothetical protein
MGQNYVEQHQYDSAKHMSLKQAYAIANQAKPQTAGNFHPP